MQPIYIKTLLQAAKVYTEFSGAMPSTTIATMEQVLTYVHQNGYFPFAEKWASTNGIGNAIFSSMKYPRNMAYGICVLWHRLGYLRRKSPVYYQLSPEGLKLTQEYYKTQEKNWDRQYHSFILERLLYLEGVNVLVSFLYDNPGKTKTEIVDTLGDEIKYHSRILAPLGVMRRRRRLQPVSKPFNQAITAMLLRLLEELRVVEREGKNYSLTPLMKTWARRVYRHYDQSADKFVWTAPKEPLILTSIAEVMQKSKQTIKMVSPFLNPKAIQLFEKANLLQEKEVNLISRDPVGRTKKALEALQKITDLSVRFLPTRKHLPEEIPKAYPLHAKMILSDSYKAGLVTSANLLHTSLTRNYEVGMLTYDPSKNHQLDELFQRIWENAIVL